MEDLVDACSDALYDTEGITKGISIRTVQVDIQIMRSDKLGYNAPIAVYDNKYYRYADPDYSIMKSPLTKEDILLVTRAIKIAEDIKDNEKSTELRNILLQLMDNLGCPQ